uniref:Uncharacterized protein n=1 Tax=Panagrolaimus sp. PS1159 TaxID=55785 RepID=A0AC35F9S7_9BILA
MSKFCFLIFLITFVSVTISVDPVAYSNNLCVRGDCYATNNYNKIVCNNPNPTGTVHCLTPRPGDYCTANETIVECKRL